MSWFGAGALVLGVGSSIMGGNAAKKAAAKQAALGREQANKLRTRSAEISKSSKREIESLRILRSLDLPAFKQASEQSMIQAQKGAERMQRHRAMGRLAPDVRGAIFGGQFKQYVGREMQRLQQHAGLTQQILQATERQQQMALQTEQQASSMELGGQMQAIQTEAAAGDMGANILGAVGSAVSAYASAASAKEAAALKSDKSFAQQAALQTIDPKSFMTKGAFDPAAFKSWWDDFQAITNPGDE
jgi:hypothetical protein